MNTICNEIVCLFGYQPGEPIEVDRENVILFTSLEEARFVYRRVVFYDGKQCDLETFSAFCKELAFDSFTYQAAPSLCGQELIQVEFWMQRCREVQWHAHLTASQWQDFRLTVARNLFMNQKRAFDSQSFLQIQDSCKGMPAFVCGAGPSLAKDLEILPKCKSQGILLAGGASLDFLTRKGIEVDIAVGLDPDPQSKRSQMEGSFETPFFYQSRFHSNSLDKVHGSLFQVPPNPQNPLEEWLEGGNFDAGWTVVTFACALAVHLGCNPIFLIGADFSSEEDFLYVGEEESSEGLFIGKDQSGKQVCAKKDWILAAKWLEHFVQKHQNKAFYRSSKKGLPLYGVEYFSLDQFLQQGIERDVEGAIHYIRAHWKQKSFLQEKREDWKKSLMTCKQQVEKLLFLYAKTHPYSPLDLGTFVVTEMDLEEEIFYKTVLTPLWEVWQYPMQRIAVDATGMTLQKVLLFQRVIQEYQEMVEDVSL